ncbi:MAG TPA: DUF4159 domain-containing protein [Verrucomicrobiae bacterium]|nr:DUF4159 domain-containing protein [Verrucomicrobiae bacterium]
MKPRLASIGFKYSAAIAVILMALLLWQAYGQMRGWGRGRRMQARNPEEVRENELMEKAINPAFKEDVFTFARLKFTAERGFGYGGGRLWDDDSPEADLNVIFRLYETTSMKVRPGVNVVDITTNDLKNYPFVYVAAAGRLDLSDEDAACLRQYMLSGGFIMADDFWGDDQWQHFYEQFKRIFPKREPVELTLDHPIFRTVFKFKKQPQIPSVGAFMQYGVSYDPGWPYENKNNEPHYYAVYDDKQHMMMLICHNNHYGDGWEHEGDDESYFDTFSEPQAYPMLFNVLVYAMSH